MAVRKMSVPKGTDQPVDRIKELYPLVNEAETPLPRSWSPKDKFNFIGLSQNNLKVHYKGTGTKCFFLLRSNLKFHFSCCCCSSSINA